MSLWEELPDGFLKMKRPTWSRLDYEVRLLITELARNQDFKCAHCGKERGLEIEHDHDPEHGPGDRYTIYNIRGLVCRRCNWHIGLYEADQRGDYRDWPDVFIVISDREYENYVYVYECRVSPLLEAMLEERLGSQNYWRRRLFLQKFDEWREWGGRYPWYRGFEEIKDQKYGRIRTPKQFLRTLYALMQYVVEQLRQDPEYQPPAEFLEIMVRVKPLFDSIRPIAEEKLRAIGGGEDVNREQ